MEREQKLEYDCCQPHIYLYGSYTDHTDPLLPSRERRCQAILKRLSASTEAVRVRVRDDRRCDAKRFSPLQSALIAKFAVLRPVSRRLFVHTRSKQ